MAMEAADSIADSGDFSLPPDEGRVCQEQGCVPESELSEEAFLVDDHVEVHYPKHWHAVRLRRHSQPSIVHRILMIVKVKVLYQ